MTRRREAGSSVLALLLLLALAAGAGAWNYRRNLEIERAEYRPFRGYTDEAMEQLAAAYEGKQSRDSHRYERASQQRVRAEGKAYFDEQVREFERAQQVGAHKKALRGELAEAQTALKLLEQERRKREQERDRVKLFFKRLLTI